MGKQKKHRKQQLREIRERRERYQAKMPQRKFSPGRFLQNHLGELFFLICFALAFVLIYSIKNKPRDVYQIESLTSSIPENEIIELRRKFPQGFRVFALVKNEILPLNIDTLPKEVTVGWGASKIINLNRDEIRFNIGRIQYKSQVLTLSLPVKLPRKEGKASNSVIINDIEITVQLIAEYSNSGIFFALGFTKY